MNGSCEFCGGDWSTNARTLTFHACCPRQRDRLEGGAEDEGDRRRDDARDEALESRYGIE